MLGTLVLTWQQPRDFTEDDRITMTAMSAYCAQAVQRAMLLEEREQAAITLQNAALSELPGPPGLRAGGALPPRRRVGPGRRRLVRRAGAAVGLDGPDDR